MLKTAEIKEVVEIRKTIQSDILPIAVNMRDADAKEIWDSHMSTPYNALVKGMESVGNSWTILVNGVPIGMVGVSRRTLISDKGVPWLLGTDAMVSNRKLFMKISKIVLKNMSKGYKYLENYVSVENTVSIRWLKRLGFTLGEEVNSMTGVIFKRFYMEVD